jgi:Domain of unknown function (DUF5666)
MNIRFLSAIVLAVTFTAVANSQNSGSATQNSSPAAQGPGIAPASGQSASPNAGQKGDAGSGGGRGQRGGRGGFGGGMGGGAGMMSRGLMGTVTEVAADHYTIKTEAGGNYVVHSTADTRIYRQVAGARAGGGAGNGAGEGQNGGQGSGAGADGRQIPSGGQGSNGGQGSEQGGGRGRGYGGGNPPQQIKPTDIKVGDTISVMGDVDATAKSVAANRIAQLDPAVIQQMHAMEANFGKTWLMGKVTAIDGTKITLTGVLDNAPYSVVADENTAFRKRRDPITLADIQVGDTVRADGVVKDGVFTATNVNVFSGSGGETPSVPRSGTSQVPQSAPAQNLPTQTSPPQ